MRARSTESKCRNGQAGRGEHCFAAGTHYSCVCGARIDQYWIQGRWEEKERRGSCWGALREGTGPAGKGEGTSVAGCGHLCLFPCCAESGCSHN